MTHLPASHIAIIGGTLIDAPGDVLIDGDRIGATGGFEIPAEAETIDATGLVILPGLIDLGVYKVEIEACAAGGITRVAPMPDGALPIDNPGLVQRAALAAKPHLWVHPLAAATKGSEGRELAEYALMARAGAKAVATGHRWIADSGVMRRALQYAAALKLTLIVHAEDSGLTAGAVATSGETATRHGLPAAPAIAEALAIARDLLLIEETGARLHFHQVTTARGLALVREAKARGLPVTCGITPAHLLLSDIAMSDFRTYARLTPPLRSEDDRQACLAALADGTIDILCSGHDPRGSEAKRLPFADADAGASGAETLLALALGLVRDGVITMRRLAELTSLNPARLLGVEAGHLDAGAPADLTLVDPNAFWIVDGTKFRSSAGNTPFQGLPVQGRAVRTIKGGRTIS